MPQPPQQSSIANVHCVLSVQGASKVGAQNAAGSIVQLVEKPLGHDTEQVTGSKLAVRSWVQHSPARQIGKGPASVTQAPPSTLHSGVGAQRSISRPLRHSNPQVAVRVASPRYVQQAS